MTGLREVGPVELRRWLETGTARLVDVREPDEHRRGRIARAELMPLAALDPGRLDTLPGVRLVVHCDGGARSREAVQRLQAAGVAEVWHLAGGLQAWKRAGLPIVADSAAPLPIMRQVQIVAGSLILLGFLLGLLLAPVWHLLSVAVGAGLIMAGTTGRCGMARLLGRLPYNRRAAV